jgi:hypothetical protein
MRSDFENFRLEFPVSVRLFRIPSDFFEFRPTFPISGQLLPKRSGNCEFPSDFGKSCPEIVISVRLSPKRSDTLRGIARRSGFTVILRNHADTWQFRPLHRRGCSCWMITRTTQEKEGSGRLTPEREPIRIAGKERDGRRLDFRELSAQTRMGLSVVTIID